MIEIRQATSPQNKCRHFRRRDVQEFGEELRYLPRRPSTARFDLADRVRGTPCSFCDRFLGEVKLLAALFEPLPEC